MGSVHGFGDQAGAERFRQARLTVAVAAITKPRVKREHDHVGNQTIAPAAANHLSHLETPVS